MTLLKLARSCGFGRVRLLAAARDALADGDAGAVDKDAFLAMGLARLGNCLVDGWPRW